MIKEILYGSILVLGVPTGLILKYMCKEEIKSWIKRLKIMSIVCLFLGLLVIFMDFKYKIAVILSLLFIIITNLTIIWKAYR